MKAASKATKPIVAGHPYCAAATRNYRESHGTGLREGGGGGDRGVAELIAGHCAVRPVLRVVLRRGLACCGGDGGGLVNARAMGTAAAPPQCAPRPDVEQDGGGEVTRENLKR